MPGALGSSLGHPSHCMPLPSSAVPFQICFPISLPLFLSSNGEVWDNVWEILDSLWRKAHCPFIYIPIYWLELTSGHSQHWFKLFRLKIKMPVENDGQECGLVRQTWGWIQTSSLTLWLILAPDPYQLSGVVLTLTSEFLVCTVKSDNPSKSSGTILAT